ncbi:TPA: OmpH family outer membrane protein [Neisseria bacilliformis]|uniref:OmpH family outer membrane protein n=1 Tax=Neisseria bacilliformis ATCC BAA-1200 TaxID=888742 RepID=F2BBT2_9NEIS|nr:OmpH family outer membrane protein [Neisseria bacilliformis]EGF11098.1 OmpH family outer membrane protein [Neisseria bacilliformis ATCC BAA-1200]QMT48254.1 OmpH family outer membrane protein [Neisseria bacilliformis]
MIKRKSQMKQWAAALAAAACLAAPAVAESVRKLGFIDVDRVYRESKQAQSIQAKLDEEFAPRQKRLEQMQQEAAGLERKAAAAKGKARDGMLADLQRRNQTLRSEQAKLAEDYDLRRNEEFAALQRNADRVMIDLAKKEGYDLIVHDVIFINAKFDITNKVIREMNR